LPCLARNRCKTRETTSEIELDLGRYELRRRGRTSEARKKAHGAADFSGAPSGNWSRARRSSRKLWRSDLFVDTETNINNIVRKIRTALGDDAAKPRFLETVVGKGTGSSACGRHRCALRQSVLKQARQRGPAEEQR
jgi:DNA-binding response OmpR family regulator